MNKRELERFRKLIENEKQIVLRDLGMIGEGIEDLQASGSSRKSYSNHMADVGSEAVEQEKILVSANKGKEYLLALEAALERIEDKTYGACEKCSAKIPVRRLEAYLAARLCVPCKSELEKLRRS